MKLKQFIINRTHRFVTKYFKVVILRCYPRFSEILIKKNLGNDLIGVEIGVWEGENSERMLKNIPIKKLYLIDPYCLLDEWEYKKEMDIKSKLDIEKAERKAHKILDKYGDRIIWIKKKSEEAIGEIKELVDFVYIDGNHKYESIKKDLEYYNIIKKGGILSGHDIGQEDVNKAVAEFSIKHKLNILTNVGEDWGFIKK